MRRILLLVGILASGFTIISYGWKLMVPFIVVLSIFLVLAKSILFRVISFNLDTHSLIEFYLKRRFPIGEKLYEKILNGLKNDKNYVWHIYVKVEEYGGFSRAKVWKQTVEPSKKESVNYGESLSHYEEGDFYGVPKMHVWEFTIADYLAESEYQSLIKAGEHKSVMPENITVEIYGGILIYGERGRFGNTFETVRGMPYAIKEPKNIFLSTTQEFLKGLKFRKASKNEDEIEKGRIYRKGKNFYEYSVVDNEDPEVFGNWNYTVRTIV